MCPKDESASASIDRPASVGTSLLQSLTRSTHPQDIPAPQDEARRTELAWTLWFEQFRQLTWFAVVAIGGGLVLIESGVWQWNGLSALSLIAFAGAALTSMTAQGRLVDRLSHAKTIDVRLKIAQELTTLLLGIGAGVAATSFLLS
jgi:hypothetical protein